MRDELRIATIDTRILADTDDEFVRYLCSSEVQRYRTLASARRRQEWLGARMAAKYLFLHRLESPHADHDDRVVTKLSRETLVSLPLWMYRNVEVTTGRHPDRPSLRFRWRGCETDMALSLSHTGHDACACMTAGDNVGIDLQKVEQRVGAFYRTNYAATERQWVERGTGCEPSSRDWLYTLLWTVKEAALKAKALVQINPVSFGGVDVFELPPPETLLRACRQDDWGGRLTRMTARIREGRNIRSLQVAIMGTQQMILTVVQPRPSAVKEMGGRSIPVEAL
jgi:phosphopantetheinyl transferase (holo-ACP synthase)